MNANSIKKINKTLLYMFSINKTLIKINISEIKYYFNTLE